MTCYKRLLQLSIIFFSMFILSPTIGAEYGQAIFKDLIIEKDGAEIVAQEPAIIFEGQSYLPLRVITDSLNKQLYLDRNKNHIKIKSNSRSTINSIIEQEENEITRFRPTITFEEQLSSEAAILIEDNIDSIMFAKQAHTTFYPASTTKILTALIALEQGDLEEKVVVTENVQNLPNDSRRAYIQPGDILTLKQLLYATLLYSGNDSALAIAEHIAGSEVAFAKLMNEKAEELGAKNSHFVNPHGYHHPEHYTTPYDLAVITKAATDIPLFLEIINTPSYKAVYSNQHGKQITRTWGTTNQFIKGSAFTTAGVIGGKTGYTDAAGRTLVTVAERNGHRYIATILKGSSSGRYTDTRKLLLKAYQTREELDQMLVKDIKVSLATASFSIDGYKLPQTEKMFIYKGRTYISQSYINESIARVHQEDVSSQAIKCQIDPAYTMDIVSIQDYSFDTLEDASLIVQSTRVQMNPIRPWSFFIGTHLWFGYTPHN